MRQVKFGTDTIGNKVILDPQQAEVIKCLFEGLTQKVPAFNFLSFVFTGQIKSVNISTMKQDLQSKYPQHRNQTIVAPIAQENPLKESKSTWKSLKQFFTRRESTTKTLTQDDAMEFAEESKDDEQ